MLDLWKRHWPIIIGIIYFLSPVDFIPDFLVFIFGPIVIIDDVFVLIIAILFSIYREYRYRQEIKMFNASKKTIIEGEEIVSA